MKLFTKYSRINVLAMVLIFIIASGAFYVTLRYVLINQIDRDLEIEEGEIKTYVREHNRLPENISVKDQFINYTVVATASNRSFTTTYINDTGKEKGKFRQLVFSIEVDPALYKVTVSKSLEETEEISESILVIAILTILIILIVSLIINRLSLKKLWRPFYQSLDEVKDFKVSKKQQLKFPSTPIDEFALMNKTLEKTTSQAQVDYLSLKTFSENASHEIQTPLAIIRSKLDLVIQDEDLTEKQSEALQTAYNSIEKLTRLNQSLLLLAKIENNQFEEVQPIDLKSKIEETVMAFHELWQAHHLEVKTSFQSAVIKMNPELADILLNNLLSNATKHNFEGGTISIELNEHSLKVENTSNLPPVEEKQLYQRFVKSSHSNEHVGLGLSIIKQICDVSGFTISYSFHENKHSFSISLN